jgi:uncharacterized protein
MMASRTNVEAVLAVLAAVELRDEAAFAAACQSDAEFCWPPSLPYGGTARGNDARRRGWAAYWDSLQPTVAERRLDPRVIAASGSEVVVLWRQRGLSPAGDKLDTEVLGLYTVRHGKLACGRMFYFDTAAVCAFLTEANPLPDTPSEPSGSTR